MRVSAGVAGKRYNDSRVVFSICIMPPPTALLADLHCHSTVSDGVFSPEELAVRAQKNGVQLWALTDHDEIGGIDSARAAAQSRDLPFVAGVEISVTWAGKTIHIVGLNIDEKNADLQNGLLATRAGRVQRAHDIATELARQGIADAFDGALRHVKNPNLISRTHFARYLVELGIAASVGEVFKRYLAEGKPGYVPHRWSKLSDAVNWIRGAGGVAVVAHPGRYPFSLIQRDAFLQEFIDVGGQAIEVITGSHTPDQYSEFAAVARRYGFHASCGSDFHAPSGDGIDLGGLPAMPGDLPPVWQLWQ